MSETQWHYGREGKQVGPVAESELKRLIDAGELGPGDLVWKEGMPNWVPAGTVQALFPDLKLADAPAAPARSAAVDTARAAAAEPGEGRAKAPPPITAELAEKARQVATAASRDAFTAIKILLSNPVGGFQSAYEALGKFRAMQVGVVFAVVFYLFVGIGGYLWYRQTFVGPSGPSAGQVVSQIITLVFVGLAPLVFVLGATTLCRRLFRGEGSIDTDIFITGASLLPMGVYCLAAGILGNGTPWLLTVLSALATSVTVLMLYSGCTNVLRISEALATPAVAIMFVAVALSVSFVM